MLKGGSQYTLIKPADVPSRFRSELDKRAGRGFDMTFVYFVRERGKVPPPRELDTPGKLVWRPWPGQRGRKRTLNQHSR